MLLFYKLLYVCNTSFINSLLQSICRWPAGFKKKSHGAHELFGVVFFPLCSNTLKTATARNRTIGKAQRCTEACRETQVWKVPVCGVWLMTEPPSDVRRSTLLAPGQISTDCCWWLDHHSEESWDGSLLYIKWHGLSYNYLENVFSKFYYRFWSPLETYWSGGFYFLLQILRLLRGVNQQNLNHISNNGVSMLWEVIPFSFTGVNIVPSSSFHVHVPRTRRDSQMGLGPAEFC